LKRFLYLIFFTVLFSFQNKADNRILDSLLIEISKLNVSDSVKIEKLYAYAEKNQFMEIRFWEALLSKAVNSNGYSKRNDIAFNLAYCYLETGLSDRALNIFLKLAKEENQQKKYHDLLQTYNEIGQVFSSQKDTASMMKYYRLSLALAIQIKDSMPMAMAYHNLSCGYKDADQFEKALKYAQLAEDICRKIQYQIGLGYVLQNKGVIQMRLKNVKEAKTYFKESAEIRRLISDAEGMCFAYSNLGYCYLLENDLNLAKSYLLLAFRIADSLRISDLLSTASLHLKEYYIRTGEYKEALKYYDIYHTVNEKATNKEIREASYKKISQFEYEKKVLSDSLKSAEEKNLTALQIKQDKKIQIFLYTGVIICVLFAVFIFRRLQITKRQKKEIEEKSIELSRQKRIIELKQNEIIDSIQYARRIQNSLITSEQYIEKVLRKLKHN
jgi:tetratricopeptide (TPR) repeat protein